MKVENNIVLSYVTVLSQNQGGIAIMLFYIVHGFVETPWDNVQPIGMCLHIRSIKICVYV